MGATIIDVKKKDVQQFPTRLEVDAQIIELGRKIERCMTMQQSLLNDVRRFVDSHNESIAQQNITNQELAGTILRLKNELEVVKNGN